MNRKPKSLRVLALLVILAGTLQSALEAQNFGRLSLSVIDNQGEPIEGVLVLGTCSLLESLRIEKTTNSKGKAILAFADATKTYDLHFEKEGFTSIDIRIKPEVRKTVTRTITMPPKSAGGGQPDANMAPGELIRFTPAEEAFNRGVTAIRASDLAAGKLAIMRALELDPKMAAGHAALAGIYLEEKDYHAALESAQTFQQLDPENSQSYRILYSAHNALGNKAEAAAALEALNVSGGGQDAAIMTYNEGVAALKIGASSSAKARFIDALALQPNLIPAHTALIAIYMDEGDFAEALASTDRLLALEPDNGKALQVRYDAYRALGDTEKQEEAFKQLVAVDPTRFGNRLYTQGIKLFNAGDLAAAAEHFEKALAADASLVRAHYHLGLCHVNQGNNAAALEHLQKFVEMAPEDADVPVAVEMLKYLGE